MKAPGIERDGWDWPGRFSHAVCQLGSLHESIKKLVNLTLLLLLKLYKAVILPHQVIPVSLDRGGHIQNLSQNYSGSHI